MKAKVLSTLSKIINIHLILLILILISPNIYAQTSAKVLISGTVVDNLNGEPLPGVNILVKEHKLGTVTDVNGKFSLEVPKDAVLIFSYVGFESYTLVALENKNVKIKMISAVTALDDLVVIGYGSTTKKETTGSIATVKKEDFNRGAYNNPLALLQGKVAGLTIVKPQGADPLAGYNVLLRGTNTLTSGQGPLVIIDGVAGANIKNISPEEIETMDILKDGAAAAIYGTRGSNGVIIITTKRAKSGFTKLEYNFQISVQAFPRKVENLNSEEFTASINQYAPNKATLLYGNSTDWFKEITRSAPLSQKHNLAITGGTESFSHRTTMYIEKSDGLLKDNESNRYILRTNVNQKMMDNHLIVDYNLGYSMRNYRPANYDLFYQAFIRNPTSAVYDPSNQYSGGYTVLEGIDYYNPVAMLNERDRQGKTNDASGNVQAKLNLFKNISWINFVSFEQSEWESISYRTKYYPSMLGKGGEAEIENGRNNTLQYETTVNHSASKGKNKLQTLIGYSFQEQNLNTSYMVNSGFDSDLYGPNNIAAGSALGIGKAEMGSYREKSRLISFFGRAIYNYDERYLATLSLRREGSSKFGENNKWGWFPAASLGWRINRESFMTNVKWVNDMKLRVGYGVTGNQNFDSYKSQIMMGIAGKFLYNGEWINTYQPTSNPNPDLRWEKKQEFNVGVDFSLFKNRIGGAIEYYNRFSTDLLYTYNVPYPPYIYPELFTNVGTISNQGVELTLNVQVIKKQNFRWNSTLIFSKNSNKLVKFSNDEFTSKYIETGWLGGPFPLYSQRVEEGKPLGTFYGPVWLGIDENGLDLFKNANPVGKVDPEDWEEIGNANPFCNLGWSNSMGYKNWDLNMSFRSSIGGKVLNMYRLYYENWTSLGRNIVHTQYENPEFMGSGQYSSKYLESGTYLKLDNISLGYNFKTKIKYVNSIRAEFVVQDVFTLTGYKGLDPEVNLSGLEPGIEYLYYYPRSTTFTFGLNVTF
jgi:TonB-linked SusC/RagA family outer membrane protein